MRELGTAADPQSAALLVDYLFTQNIPAQARAEAGKSVIWIRNEDDLERAQQIQREFLQNPQDAKYAACHKTARDLRQLKERADKKKRGSLSNRRRFLGPAHSRQNPVHFGSHCLKHPHHALDALWQ